MWSLLKKKTSPVSSTLVATLKENAVLLNDDRDLHLLIEGIGDARIVMLGEASHGTHEYYTWRSLITRRLIEESNSILWPLKATGLMLTGSICTLNTTAKMMSPLQRYCDRSTGIGHLPLALFAIPTLIVMEITFPACYRVATMHLSILKKRKRFMLFT